MNTPASNNAAQQAEEDLAWLRNGAVLALTLDRASLRDGRYRDRSPASNDASIVGAPRATDGRVGDALAFNGGDRLTLNALSARTVAIWVRPDAESPTIWFDAGVNDRLRGFLIGTYAPRQFPHFDMPDRGVTVGFWQVDCLVDAPLRAGQWVHIVVVYDGAQHVHVAVNGRFPSGRVVDGGGSGTSEVGAQPLRLADAAAPSPERTSIGGMTVPFPGLSSFRGALDEVAVWDRAFTTDEVAELYRLAQMPEGYCAHID